MSKTNNKTIIHTLADYYDKADIMDEILDESIELTLERNIRRDILNGKRKRRLKNLTIKMDPIQIQAVRKIATMKSIPYQTLIRHWIAQEIKKELLLEGK
jgi:predicted DNA binding CopG/RHH family protein